jgi:hypothetical protein
MCNKSAQPTENKPARAGAADPKRARHRDEARIDEQSPPGDRKSAAVDTEQRALAEAVDDLDGRD